MNTDEYIVSQVLAEFLEVAIHNILQCKRIYPDTIFKRQQKYGVVVYKSVHPELNEYITQCVKTAHELIKKNQLIKLEICFMNMNQKLEEKIVFDILDLKNKIDSDTFLLQIEKSFRAFCVRLHAAQGFVEPLSDDVTFIIQIHTTDSASMEHMENPAFENFPWYHIDAANTELLDSEILPIHTVKTDFMGVQIYVEKKMD